LGGVLAARGIPLDHLALSLDWLAEFFAGKMAAADGALVAAALRGARAQFLEAGAAPIAPPISPAPWPQVSIFEAALLAGKPREALAIMNGCLDEGKNLVEFELHVIQPALYQIGEKWETNRISVAQEHMATAIVHSVMSVGLLRSPPPAPNGRRLVLACVEGNQHSVGLRMVADAFQLAGWEVQYLGANVPSAALVAQVLAWKPDLVGLSMSLAQQLPAVRAVIAQLQDQLGGNRPPVIVGGLAFNRCNQLVVAANADAFNADAPTAVRAAERIVSAV
jgi:methanogenic corrinoid protein MtbC1